MTDIITTAIEAVAQSDADFDGRPWKSLGRRDRERYIARSRKAIAAYERTKWTVGAAERERG